MAFALHSVHGVQVVLAIPVGGLIAGAAFGVRWPDVPLAWFIAALCGWTLLAVHAARVSQVVLLSVAACGAFAAGGAVLAADAWHAAWRPTLRVVFEAIAHDERHALLDAGLHPPEDGSARVVISGRLDADAAPTASGAVSLAIEAEWVGRLTASERADAAVNPVRGGVLLTVLGAMGPERMSEWRAGRRVRMPAELRRPSRYLNPGVPDQERALARRGVTLVGTVKSGALVEVMARASPVAEAAASARAFARRALQRSVGPSSPRAAAIVSAIVIGDRTGLEPEVERRLQESGTYHVIAISGGNIALLAGLLLGMFRIAGVLGRTAMFCAAGMLVVYGGVVAGGASVERAVLMAVIYFVGRGLDLRGPPFLAFVLAAGVLVLADPLSVADTAMLLTFGATGALIGASPLIGASSAPPALRPAATLVAASVAVELVLMPVAAVVFSRVTFAGLVLNLGAIPAMAVAQCGGMAALLLDPIMPSLARITGWAAAAGADALVATAGLVELAPWSTWRVASPGALPVWVYYGAVGGAWTLWRFAGAPARGSVRSRALFHVCVACALASGLWILRGGSAFGARPPDGRLIVTFIDVGQGDAALVQFPLGSAMLIDAGGLAGSTTFDVGDRVVGPVLRELGVTSLSVLALTHGDADHMGGAAAVVRDFRPHDVWEGVPVPAHQPLQALHAAVGRHAFRWTTLQQADRLDVDGVEILVRHPPRPDWERQDVRNDDSIVLELRWRDVSFVFTGDISREVEQDIAGLFEPAPLRVLKVPHHGSSTSSSEAFVRALRPGVAVVSVGRSNRFGHPARAVLERYRRAGTELFRTDQDGAVRVETDGTALTVRGFTGKELRVPRRAGPQPPAVS
ncbi:MAG: DNA internalization-related competence protein ComEC/Rec2 [Vicinamibacterales bacterium]